MVTSNGSSKQGVLVRSLQYIEKVGNRLPDPLTLFFIFAVLVVVLSAIFAGASVEMMQRSGEVEIEKIRSLLSIEGVRWMFTNAIDNFIGFAPLGPVLTVMLGIGVAERTGFISMGLRVLVSSVPKSLITAALVFGAVMSSMVADAGYIVLTPLGALLFAGLGRHPIAGLAATYAGVSGGYSANLLITGLDPLLARLTDQAAKTIDPEYAVHATANYYFMVVSVVLIVALGTWVTNRIVEPMLGKWDPSQAGEDLEEPSNPTGQERKHFFISLGAAVVVAGLLSLLVALPNSPLRVPTEEGQPAISALRPFFTSIEVLIALLFILPAMLYGILNRSIRSDKDVAKMASDSMASMGTYVVLAFIAGQFVAYFNWTNMGVVTAVQGAGFLESIGLVGTPLILAFIAVAAVMNIFVGSASAKWAFMAPIFVPMMMMMGLSPELVQVSYRIGDSVTNIITPLMPYLPIIIVFARRYDKNAGIGTIISAMLPYSIAFSIGWVLMLIVWLYLGLPLGPGAETAYAY